jgi:hypothetical protein
LLLLLVATHIVLAIDLLILIEESCESSFELVVSHFWQLIGRTANLSPVVCISNVATIILHSSFYTTCYYYAVFKLLLLTLTKFDVLKLYRSVTVIS